MVRNVFKKCIFEAWQSHDFRRASKFEVFAKIYDEQATEMSFPV